MANTIKLKRASGSDPSASDLSVGELAIRTSNCKLFSKNDGGSAIGIVAGSADTLTTARTIAGVSFDGSANISLNNNAITNGAGYLADIVSDTSPQLGGNLDLQSSGLTTSTSNGNIKATPNGTGVFEVLSSGSVDGTLQLNCTVNSHGIKLRSPAHSAGQSYTFIFPDNQIAADKYLKVKSISGSGSTASGQLEYASLDANDLGEGTIPDARFPSTLPALNGSALTNLNADNISSGTISASRIPTLNQNTTGSAATLTTARTIAGVSFDGSANISLNNNAITNGAGYITATLTNEEVQDIVGGMVTGNTETGISVTYQDADGTLDFVVGTLNQDTTGTATNASNVQVGTLGDSVGPHFIFMKTGSSSEFAEPKVDAGISYNSSTNTLSVAGDVIAFASDDRLKTDKLLIDNPLDKVMQIEGFTFNFNEIGSKIFDTSVRHVGVSAQQIQKVLPEAVASAPINIVDDEDYLTVKYDKLVPLLIEAIKELNKKVEKLEQKLSDK